MVKLHFERSLFKISNASDVIYLENLNLLPKLFGHTKVRFQKYGEAKQRKKINMQC